MSFTGFSCILLPLEMDQGEKNRKKVSLPVFIIFYFFKKTTNLNM